MIAEAKRENVQLQLEAAFRKRLMQAHSEIKRRLDYMADLEDAKRRFQRRYMIDWIVDQVRVWKILRAVQVGIRLGS